MKLDDLDNARQISGQRASLNHAAILLGGNIYLRD